MKSLTVVAVLAVAVLPASAQTAKWLHESTTEFDVQLTGEGTEGSFSGTSPNGIWSVSGNFEFGPHLLISADDWQFEFNAGGAAESPLLPTSSVLETAGSDQAFGDADINDPDLVIDLGVNFDLNFFDGWSGGIGGEFTETTAGPFGAWDYVVDIQGIGPTLAPAAVGDGASTMLLTSCGFLGLICFGAWLRQGEDNCSARRAC